MEDASITPKRGPGRPRRIHEAADNSQLLMTRSELASRLGISLSHTYELERTDPDFPTSFKIGGMGKYLRSDLDAYLKGKLKQAQKERRAAMRSGKDEAEAA